MKHTLEREQQLSCDLATAWDFFSSPLNLGRITPPDMRFTVTSAGANKPIFEGMRISYTVSPLFGIPLKWCTLITEVAFQESFADTQEQGPYKLWHHRHVFTANDKGVLMRDTVTYELPFGFIGEIAHKLLVKKKVEHIFDYRYKVLDKLFNS